MPFFRSTYNILTKTDEDELFNPNWMDSDKMVLPPQVKWDYAREMQIEDVDIWEQIYFESGGTGLYVSWSPYAEFYMITKNVFYGNPDSIETFYGPLAGVTAYKRAKNLGIPVTLNKIWVENEDMWLHKQSDDNNKTIFV